MATMKKLYPVLIDDHEVINRGDTQISGGSKEASHVYSDDSKTPTATGDKKSVTTSDTIKKIPKSISMSFGVDSRDIPLFDHLKYVIAEVGKCSITDTFFGKFDNVKIEHYDIVEKKDAVGIFDFVIRGTILEDFKDAVVTRDLLSEFKHLTDEALSEFFNLGEKVDQWIAEAVYNTKLVNEAVSAGGDIINEVISYSDRAVNLLSSGISAINKSKNRLNSTINQVKDSTLRIASFYDALKNLKEVPQDLKKNLTSFKNIREKFVEDKKLPYPKSPSIFRGTITDPRSPLEIEDARNESLTNGVLNTIAFIEDLILLFNFKFEEKVTFKIHIKSLLQRIPYTLADKENKINLRDMIEKYANGIDLPDVEEVEIKDGTIREYVYKRYGNLNYYRDILRMNNLRKDYAFKGTIKVFA